MRTGLLCLSAISMMAENCLSFLSLKPTLPGLMVLVERLRAACMVGKKLVADVVKVTHQRHGDAPFEQALLDIGNGGCRLIAIDGNAHQFGAGRRQRRHLARGTLDI